MKNKYIAWLSNEQGAVCDIFYEDNTNIRAIYDYARANYGSGWTLHIKDAMSGDEVLRRNIN